ncbi:MAG: hypothetical protein ACREM1_02405 [Longimicrobiales bacterium]
MRKNDILYELHAKTLSLEEAERIYDSVMDSDEIDISARLGLSRAEMTALSHGVWFDELAQWRYGGWPESCFRCGLRIEPTDFGWLAKEQGEGHVLVHLRCPSRPGQENGQGTDRA